MHEARARFAAARVARLATVRPDGRPHVVPVVFALVCGPEDDTIWTAVDRKPKTTTALQRLANVRAQPRVSLLADRYDNDWSLLWWVRADGVARVVDADDPESVEGMAALTAKYVQYRADPPPGPFLRVDVTDWAAWSSARSAR